jgi:hypothetical protein
LRTIRRVCRRLSSTRRPPRASGAIGDVHDNATDIAAFRFKFGNGLSETCAIDIEQRNAGAVVGHRLGISQADAAGATGDDSGKAFYVEQLTDFHLAVP